MVKLWKLKQQVFFRYHYFLISYSNENSIKKVTSDFKSLVVQEFNYDQSYIDKHTEDCIDATHIFMAA